MTGSNINSGDDMIRRLREHRREDIEELEAIRLLMAGEKDDPGMVEKLDKLVTRFKASVKMD